MKKFLAITFVCISLGSSPAVSFAASSSPSIKIPPATDYDFKPEEFFSDWETPGFTALPERVSQTYPTELKSESPLENFYWPVPRDVLDWQTLIDLNRRAEQTWDILIHCEGTNQKTLRQRYVNASFCKEGRKELRRFHQEVGGFLASTGIAKFILKGVSRTDRAEPKALSPFDVETVRILVGYDPKEPRLLLEDPDSVFWASLFLDGVSAPRFHPLLIQVLLEYLAAGYPLNYGTYNCGGVRCVVGLLTLQRMTPMILDTDEIYWGIHGYLVNEEDNKKREKLLQYVNALMTADYLPDLSIAEITSDKLQLLRQAKTAARLLNFLSIGKIECADWGLWPSASSLLLGTIAQSEYSLEGASTLYRSKDLDFLATRLSEACEQPIPYITVRPGATDRMSIQFLAAVGSWRKLLERQLNAN